LDPQSLGARDTAHEKALLAVRVAFVESNTIGEVFDGVAVEVDLETLHAFRMVAGCRDVAGD
jgi:hypothetical protein